MNLHTLAARFSGFEIIPKDMTCPTPGRSKKPLHAEDSIFVIVGVICKNHKKRPRCDVGNGRRVKCPPTPRKKVVQESIWEEEVKIGSCPFPPLFD